jgi:H+/Cl- antiporter ClcA
MHVIFVLTVLGLIALFNDDLFVVGQRWIFEFDLTTWGWIHLIMGAVVIVAGVLLFQGGRGPAPSASPSPRSASC